MTQSPHITESRDPPTGLDCRVSIDVPPKCSEARLLRIIGVGIDAFEKLSGSRRQWTVATQIEPTPGAEQAEAQAAATQPIPPQSPRRQHGPRNPSIASLIKRAEKTGKRVTSIVTADGTTINFDETEPSDASNPWFADLPKETKQ